MGVSISRRFPELVAADQFAVEDIRAGIIGLDRVPELHTNDYFTLGGDTVIAGTGSLVSGELGHPGILNVLSGSASGDFASLSNAGTSTSTPIYLPNVVTARFVFRMPDVSNFRLYVGFGQDTAANRLGNNSLLVEYNPASSSAFTFVSKSGGVAVTDSGTTEPTNGTWYCVDFVRTDANIMQFYVNEELEGEITGLASAAVGRMVSGMTLSASARSYDIDLARFEIVSDERF